MKILSYSLTALLALGYANVHAAEGHDHGHDHGAGHAEAGDHGHGDAVELGESTIGAWTVEAERLGEIVAGKEAVIELSITPEANKPAAVRAWIGVESGKGSVKAKGVDEGDDWHVHLEVPAELPADAQLWVSLESADGTATKGAFALAPPAAK